MENCKFCQKGLTHVPGRKEKSFCNVNCRNKYFYAERKKMIEAVKATLVDLPADFVNVKKIGILNAKGEVVPLTPSKVALQDATAPNKTVKPITDPKPQTNYTVDTRPKMPAGLSLSKQIEWREKNGG